MALEIEHAIVEAALDAFEARRLLGLKLDHVAALARELVPNDQSTGGSDVLSDEERVLTALRIARKALAAAEASP